MNTRFQKISINGRIFEPDKAKINAADKVLLCGIAAFETFRVADGRVFLLEEHFDRLNRSLKALRVDWPDDRPQYYKWVWEISGLIDKNYDSLIRFMVTAGVKKPEVIIYLNKIEKSRMTESSAVVFKNFRRQVPEYFTETGFRIKTPEYVAPYLANAKLKSDQEAIFLSPEGFVTEALTSNVLWVENGQIFTPPLNLGILPGVTRHYLVQNFSVHEKLIGEAELEKADEVWLSGSGKGLRAQSRINNLSKPGLKGSIFQNTYTKLAADIKKFSKDIHKF